MAQTTILALGSTEATSSDITIARGYSIAVGIFTASGTTLQPGEYLTIVMDTPGADVFIAKLFDMQPAVLVNGPGVFRVLRKASANSIGVFTEDA